MKTVLVFIFTFLLMAFLFPFNGAMANDNTDFQITLNKQKGLLSVKGDGECQWYYNGKKIAHHSKDLKVLADGNYKVEITTDENETITKSMNVSDGEEKKNCKIFIIGDSTAQGWADVFYPQEGWGAVLQPFFDSTVTVVNAARSARSAKSFYDEGRWDNVLAELSAGDYVLIQFGINDGNSDPARHTDPFTTFQDYLTTYVNDTREKGAHPILLTTVRRNSWESIDPPTMYPAWHDYPVATRELAGELDVPLIDIDQTAKTLLESLGPEYTGPFIYLHLNPGEYKNYPDGRSDDVHFQEMGAIEMARLVVEGVEDLSEDTVVNKLIPAIRPMKKVEVTSNFPDAAVMTRTAGYPEGIHVTLKAVVDSGYGFTGWLNKADSTILDTNMIYSFTMDTSALSIEAVLDDDPQFLDCQGINYGTAFYDDCGNCVGGKSIYYACHLDFPDDTFKIEAVHSRKCIEGTTGIFQETCSQAEGQKWIFKREGEYFTIQNVETGSYIGANSIEQVQDLVPVSTPQLWRIEEVNAGVYLIATKENDKLVWDVYQVSTNSGTKLIFWERTLNNNQKFRIYKPKDCNGVSGGTAFIDSCGNCAGGTTGNEPITDPSECVNSTALLHGDDNNIQLGENPFFDESTLQLTATGNSPYVFNVYDFHGTLVKRYNGFAGDALNFGRELSSGIYFGSVVMDDKIFTVKFLKR